MLRCIDESENKNDNEVQHKKMKEKVSKLFFVVLGWKGLSYFE